MGYPSVSRPGSLGHPPAKYDVIMGKIHEHLDDRLIQFIGRQHVSFAGTAPDAPDGHLNVSPKGLLLQRQVVPA